MGDLARAILDGNAEGADPGPHGLRARRLLDLVRQHIDTEVHCMLPLLQSQALPAGPSASATGAGYLTPPTTRQRAARVGHRIIGGKRPG